MSIHVKGHACHGKPVTLTIQGCAAASTSMRCWMAEDSRAIREFLRDNLPSGTLDRLAARLAAHALDALINSDRLDESGDTNEVRAALAEWTKELDAPPGEFDGIDWTAKYMRENQGEDDE